MKKTLLAVTLISVLFASPVMAADNTPTAPDFGKLRESAAAPFRLLGNLIGGNKAEAAQTQPQTADESAIAITRPPGIKIEFRQGGQGITVSHACAPGKCGFWDARVEFRKKGMTVGVDLELKEEGNDLLEAGFSVLAPTQASPECDSCPPLVGVVLTPGEYLVHVTPWYSYRKETEHDKARLGSIRLGMLTVTSNSVTARKLGYLNEAEFLGKKPKNGNQFN